MARSFEERQVTEEIIDNEHRNAHGLPCVSVPLLYARGSSIPA